LVLTHNIPIIIVSEKTQHDIPKAYSSGNLPVLVITVYLQNVAVHCSGVSGG
jgi:hypothetical protein